MHYYYKHNGCLKGRLDLLLDTNANYFYSYENKLIKMQNQEMNISNVLDEPISIETAQGKFYYLFDGLGSVTGLTDDGGNLVAIKTPKYII